MAKKVSLSQYLQTKTQAAVASELGITQGAVWQMLRDGRQIELTIIKNRVVKAQEVRQVGRITTHAA